MLEALADLKEIQIIVLSDTPNISAIIGKDYTKKIRMIQWGLSHFDSILQLPLPKFEKIDGCEKFVGWIDVETRTVDFEDEKEFESEEFEGEENENEGEIDDEEENDDEEEIEEKTIQKGEKRGRAPSKRITFHKRFSGNDKVWSRENNCLECTAPKGKMLLVIIDDICRKSKSDQVSREEIKKSLSKREAGINWKEFTNSTKNQGGVLSSTLLNLAREGHIKYGVAETKKTPTKKMKH